MVLLATKFHEMFLQYKNMLGLVKINIIDILSIYYLNYEKIFGSYTVPVVYRASYVRQLIYNDILTGTA